VALIITDVSDDRIASIFRVHECEQVTERGCKLLYRQRLVEDFRLQSVLIRATRCHLPEDDNQHANCSHCTEKILNSSEWGTTTPGNFLLHFL
jgi:hypothetical protein